MKTRKSFLTLAGVALVASVAGTATASEDLSGFEKVESGYVQIAMSGNKDDNDSTGKDDKNASSSDDESTSSNDDTDVNSNDENASSNDDKDVNSNDDKGSRY